MKDTTTAETITLLKVLGASIKENETKTQTIIDGIKASSAQWLIGESIKQLEKEIDDADLVLSIARHCERISKRGGDHAKEYKRLAQHLKKSAGHLRALEEERTKKT